MSLSQPVCPKCSVARDCEYVAWYRQSAGHLFGVLWRCPICGERSLAVSPRGPDRIGPDTCLQCGFEGSRVGVPCPSCGVSLAAVLSTRELSLPDDVLLELAREALALGTCRRAITITNYVLQRNGRSEEARQIKKDFIDHLDAQEPFP